MQPYNLQSLCQAFGKASKDYVLYLPRTSDLNQLAEAATGQNHQVPVIHYCINGASKVRKEKHAAYMITCIDLIVS